MRCKTRHPGAGRRAKRWFVPGAGPDQGTARRLVAARSRPQQRQPGACTRPVGSTSTEYSVWVATARTGGVAARSLRGISTILTPTTSTSQQKTSPGEGRGISALRVPRRGLSSLPGLDGAPCHAAGCRVVHGPDPSHSRDSTCSLGPIVAQPLGPVKRPRLTAVLKFTTKERRTRR